MVRSAAVSSARRAVRQRRSPSETSEAGSAAAGANQLTAHQEVDLIFRARHDPDAFAPLYEVYVDIVWRFALARLHDANWADDTTSIVFARCLAALPEFTPEIRGGQSTFRSWLLTIARNTVTDQFRQDRRHAPLDSSEPTLRLVDPGRSVEELAIAADERRRLHMALARLTPVQRQIVELRAAGLKGTEIAAVLDMRVSAVRTAHFRAYQRLRALLTENDRAPGEENHDA